MLGYAVNKSVIRLRREQMVSEPGALPPILAETLPHLPLSHGSIAIVCKGRTCLPPISDPAKLLATLSAR